MASEDTSVAIIGAGPYGLSLAAHLRARKVDFRIFGAPMQFWKDLPAGINLKSLAFSTNIFVPEKGHTYPEWCRARGLEDYEPCTMESFTRYGLDVQSRFVPDVDPSNVASIAASDGGFAIELRGGGRLRARSIVVATGISDQAYIPEVLKTLPRERVSHTFGLADFSVYRGKRVAVLGAGSSGIEAGALVREAGGEPHVLVREPDIVFLERTARVRPLLQRIFNPTTALGTGRKLLVLEHMPWIPHYLSDERRLRMLHGHFKPTSPWWIKDRVAGKFPISTSTLVAGARPTRTGVCLTLSAGGEQREADFDRVIAGTGYTRDVDRVSFLDADLKRRISRIEQAPRLSESFETSVPGLYFIGPMSEHSFGPLVRFVAGAGYTARTLSRHLARGRRRSVLPVASHTRLAGAG